MSEADVDLTPRPIRPLLTEPELLRLLPVPRTVLDRLLTEGQLRAVRIGARRYYRPEDIEDFLRSCSG
jgi:hypothetical protein